MEEFIQLSINPNYACELYPVYLYFIQNMQAGEEHIIKYILFGYARKYTKQILDLEIINNILGDMIFKPINKLTLVKELRKYDAFPLAITYPDEILFMYYIAKYCKYQGRYIKAIVMENTKTIIPIQFLQLCATKVNYTPISKRLLKYNLHIFVRFVPIYAALTDSATFEGIGEIRLTLHHEWYRLLCLKNSVFYFNEYIEKTNNKADAMRYLEYNDYFGYEEEYKEYFESKIGAKVNIHVLILKIDNRFKYLLERDLYIGNIFIYNMPDRAECWKYAAERIKKNLYYRTFDSMHISRECDSNPDCDFSIAALKANIFINVSLSASVTMILSRLLIRNKELLHILTTYYKDDVTIDMQFYNQDCKLGWYNCHVFLDLCMAFKHDIKRAKQEYVAYINSLPEDDNYFTMISEGKVTFNSSALIIDNPNYIRAIAQNDYLHHKFYDQLKALETYKQIANSNTKSAAKV